MVGSAHVLAAGAQHEDVDLRHIAMTFRKLVTVRDLVDLVLRSVAVVRDPIALVGRTCRMGTSKLANVTEKARLRRTVTCGRVLCDGSCDFTSQLGDSGNPLHLLGIAFTTEEVLKSHVGPQFACKQTQGLETKPHSF